MTPKDARPIIIGHCPRCAGTGTMHVTEEGEMITCTRCEGQGDLDSYRLMEAYRIGFADGRRAATLALREAASCIRLGAESTIKTTDCNMTPREIRSRIGG